MINKLTRQNFREDGIFSKFYFEGDDDPFMVTLEHAYDDGNGGFSPKVKPGSYICRRGHHVLHCGPIETFEVTGVEGHSGILCCHPGNYNKDSDGCMLSGTEIETTSDTWYVTESRVKFEAFMKRLEGVDEFTLVVD